jgi:predicted metal-dependent peptidase
MLEYKSFEERWEWLLAFMDIDDPFVAEMLTIISVERDDSIHTMGVMAEGSRIRLLYSRPFVESLSDESVRYVLCHEIDHLALHHCTTRQAAEGEDMKRHNVAADLEVNSLIVENQFRRRPPPPMQGLHAKEMGLPEKLSLEQYLNLLPKDAGKKGGKGKGKGDGSGDGSADGDKDEDQSPSDKNDGSGKDKGKSQPSNDKESGAGGDKDEDQSSNGGQGGNDPSDHGGFDNHDGWSSDNMVADEIIRQKIREMENSSRYWGNMPGDVKQHILEAQRSKVAWHKLLRYRYGQLVSKGFVHTFKRPNRRFGYPYTGFKRDGVDRVLLLWDLSGSMGQAEKSRLLSETNRIAEQQPVDVLMFDYGLIGKVVPFNRKMKFVETEGGGGGTSFKEPFEYADMMRYSTVVCLTDGCAEAIPKPKHVKHILWAIVGMGKPPVDWGQVVNIDTVEGRLL